MGCIVYLLPTANEFWGKVMFLHVYVILSIGGFCIWRDGSICIQRGSAFSGSASGAGEGDLHPRGIGHKIL